MKKFLFFFSTFYILAVLQSSFLIFFSLQAAIINFLIVVALILNLFEKPEAKNGIFIAATGGFFWDIFSSLSFGIYTLSFAFGALMTKTILKKYLKPNFYFKKN